MIGHSITGHLQQLIPTSILSGCAPFIGMEFEIMQFHIPFQLLTMPLGDAQIECTNYIACCVPEGRGKDGLKNIFTPILSIILNLLLTIGLG